MSQINTNRIYGAPGLELILNVCVALLGERTHSVLLAPSTSTSLQEGGPA